MNDRVEILNRLIKEYNANGHILGYHINPKTIEGYEILHAFGFDFNVPFLEEDGSYYYQHEAAVEPNQWLGLLRMEYNLCNIDKQPDSEQSPKFEYGPHPQQIYYPITNAGISNGQQLIVSYLTINPSVALTHLLELIFVRGFYDHNNTINKPEAIQIIRSAIIRMKCDFDPRSYIPVIDEMINYVPLRNDLSPQQKQNVIDYLTTIRQVIMPNPIAQVLQSVPPKGQFPGGTEYYKMLQEEYPNIPQANIKNYIMSLNANNIQEIDELRQLLKIYIPFTSYEEALQYLKQYASQL